jgi:hypothetical protein
MLIKTTFFNAFEYLHYIYKILENSIDKNGPKKIFSLTGVAPVGNNNNNNENITNGWCQRLQLGVQDSLSLCFHGHPHFQQVLGAMPHLDGILQDLP